MVVHSVDLYFWCTVYVRDRDAPGLDTVVPLETTAAYNMMDVITGVSRYVTYLLPVIAAKLSCLRHTYQCVYCVGCQRCFEIL